MPQTAIWGTDNPVILWYDAAAKACSVRTAIQNIRNGDSRPNVLIVAGKRRKKRGGRSWSDKGNPENYE